MTDATPSHPDRIHRAPRQDRPTRGRNTGRPRTNPVTVVERGGRRWLVAPYGPVSWVHNAVPPGASPWAAVATGATTPCGRSRARRPEPKREPKIIMGARKRQADVAAGKHRGTHLERLERSRERLAGRLTQIDPP